MRAMSGQMAYPLCRKGEGNGVLVGQSQTDFQVRDRRRVHLEPSAQGQRRGETKPPENLPGGERGERGFLFRQARAKEWGGARPGPGRGENPKNLRSGGRRGPPRVVW